MSKRKISGNSSNDSNHKKPRVSQNTNEGTIFIRNLNFDTEEESLKEFVEQNFGKTKYCLICRDKSTDESKGTAFAKFENPEDASKCLREFKDRDMQTKFHLDGRNLMVFPAIGRDEVSKINHKEEKKRDKRNLALAKIGDIHSASDEAKELSKSDQEKRKVLGLRKHELLKNLHNFVSDTRLCIHNLPPSVDDQKLRALFEESIQSKHLGAKIVECRVMRNKKGGGKLGSSKGFGFVAFSKHEHALAALKYINNNPSIFSRDKRPIVEFSIENMVALNKKKTRLINSQRKNKALQTKNSDSGSKDELKSLVKKPVAKSMKAIKKSKRNKFKNKLEIKS